MVRKQPTRRQIAKTMKRLDDEDKERVLDFARQLAKGGNHTSLADDSATPSYVAVAGEEEYETERKKRERDTWG